MRMKVDFWEIQMFDGSMHRFTKKSDYRRFEKEHYGLIKGITVKG